MYDTRLHISQYKTLQALLSREFSVQEHHVMPLNMKPVIQISLQTAKFYTYISMY